MLVQLIFPVGSGEINQENLDNRIQLPRGFAFTVYADDVPNARIVRFTHTGDLLVATPNRDQVLLLKRDVNKDGKHDGKQVLLDKLSGPNGLDFYQDWLYVAESDAIGRIKFDHQSGKTSGEYERIITGLPGGGNHWKKTLKFGPDNLLYVTIGSSCNVCIEEDKRRAAMMRYRPDGSGEEYFATGLRNSANFDWSPWDGAIYATDNGRDLLGDDFPPCELNKVERGSFYGWPFVNGDNIVDPDYGEHELAGKQKNIAPVHGF